MSKERSGHWIGPRLRELRQAAGLSLAQFQEKTSVPAVAMGSYERGDRRATVERADELLAIFGKKLAVVDLAEAGGLVVRTKAEMLQILEALTEQLKLSLQEDSEHE